MSYDINESPALDIDDRRIAIRFTIPFIVTAGPSRRMWSCNYGCGPFANHVAKDAEGVVIFEQYCPHERPVLQPQEPPNAE